MACNKRQAVDLIDTDRAGKAGRTRVWTLLLGLLFMTGFGGGCEDSKYLPRSAPLIRTEPEPAALRLPEGVRSANAPPSLAWQEQGGRYVSLSVEIDETGLCLCTFGTVSYEPVPGKDWKIEKEAHSRSSIVLDRNTLNRMRRLVTRDDVLKLDRLYRGAADDYTQARLRIRIGDYEKRVRADAYFPSEIRQIARFIHTEILEARAGDIEKAQEVGEGGIDLIFFEP
jgi:hypothetical protein